MAHISRRGLLKAGAGLMVAFALPRAASASERTLDNASVDGFIAIGRDGAVTLYSGKVDIGTGVRIAFRQMVAEELGVGVDRITLIEGDTGLTPDQGGTGGSSGIPVGGVTLRRAAATARQALVHMAAVRLNRPEGDLEAIDGAVRPKAGGAGIGFGDLIGDATEAERLVEGKGADASFVLLGLHCVHRLQCAGDPLRTSLGYYQPESGEAVEDASHYERPHGAVRKEAGLQNKKDQSRWEPALIRRPATAVDVDHHASLLAGPPHRVVHRRVNRVDPAPWRNAGKERTPPQAVVGDPVDVLHGLLHVVRGGSGRSPARRPGTSAHHSESHRL